MMHFYQASNLHLDLPVTNKEREFHILTSSSRESKTMNPGEEGWTSKNGSFSKTQ
jgi:hypothetical protein